MTGNSFAVDERGEHFNADLVERAKIILDRYDRAMIEGHTSPERRKRSKTFGDALQYPPLNETLAASQHADPIELHSWARVKSAASDLAFGDVIAFDRIAFLWGLPRKKMKASNS